ncbi:hypothetical protein BRD56_05395 [Thermoplasmatales archaeon SW_10_69_26]|nr:MAG: hypothetical protein BRD56_05395 [Thermoplasmatales archaeon SW_10_69_26]
MPTWEHRDGEDAPSRVTTARRDNRPVDEEGRFHAPADPETRERLEAAGHTLLKESDLKEEQEGDTDDEEGVDDLEKLDYSDLQDRARGLREEGVLPEGFSLQQSKEDLIAGIRDAQEE